MLRSTSSVIAVLYLLHRAAFEGRSCVQMRCWVQDLYRKYVKWGRTRFSDVDEVGRFYTRSQNCEKRLLASSCLIILFVRPRGTTLLPMFWWSFMFKLPPPPGKSDKNNWYFTWKPFTIMILSRRIVLEMRNLLNKSGRENENTFHIQ